MKPQLFIDLLILDVINLFIFSHGTLIYYLMEFNARGKSLWSVYTLCTFVSFLRFILPVHQKLFLTLYNTIFGVQIHVNYPNCVKSRVKFIDYTEKGVRIRCPVGVQHWAVLYLQLCGNEPCSKEVEVLSHVLPWNMLYLQVLSFRTDRPGQTVQTQVRQLGPVWSGSTLFAIPSASFGCITIR